MTAITSYATFTTALAELSVTGVTRAFTHPPESLGTADLPALWPGLPSGNEPMLTFQTKGGWPEMTCDLVVAVEPVPQNIQSANYDDMITIIDNLSTALRAASIGRGPLTWTIAGNAQVTVAGTIYWAVIATVTGY